MHGANNVSVSSQTSNLSISTQLITRPRPGRIRRLSLSDRPFSYDLDPGLVVGAVDDHRFARLCAYDRELGRPVPTAMDREVVIVRAKGGSWY